nr:hypothetical protein [Butyrivibrio sp.]
MKRKFLSVTISKRILAQALAALMAVTAVPVNAVAAEDAAALSVSGQEDFAGETGGELGGNNGFDNDGSSGGELGGNAGSENDGSSGADGGAGNGDDTSITGDGADYGADAGEDSDGSLGAGADDELGGAGLVGVESEGSLALDAEDLEDTEFTLLAGEGSFDREELLALLEDASEIEDADLTVEGLKPVADLSSEKIEELTIYVAKGQTFEDAVVFVDADSDGIIDNALALDKLPKPVRDDYDFVCWYLEK